MFDSGEGVMDISSLSNLLKESNEAIKHREGETVPPVKLAPSNIVKSTFGNNSKSNDVKKATTVIDPLAIWTYEEIPNEEDLIDKYDNRPAPKYEFFFKQIVGSEDVFLGLSDKSPSAADCTHLVIKIHFPGATMKDLDLDVTKNRIKASSAKFKLFTYFPLTVDSEKGVAKFDPKKDLLSVTLPIIHDY